MSSNLAISLVIGASVGGAIAGIKSLRNEFKIFRDQTQGIKARMGSLGLNAVKGFMSLGSMATAVGTSITSMAQPAIKFESAMADVKKVVDFKTPEGFKNLSKDILELTRTLPMTAEELAAITASGGQLGVAEQDLKEFTTTIAKMSVAFDMSAEQSGDSMAKLANVYKIPISKIGDLGDAINELSNSSPAKASDIVNTLGRIAGVSKDFGLTENAAAALANTFISLGKSPEVASTAINGMLTSLNTADKGGKKFQAALKEVGISAKQLKKNIAKDGQGAIVDFLKRVEKLPKAKRTGVLVDLFGKEYADDVSSIAGNVDLLEKSIKTLQDTDENGKPKYLGSMEKEFAARSATTENNLQLLKNGFNEIGITLGSSLLPIINNVVNAVKPLVHSFSDWIAKNPTYVEWGLQFGGALISLVGGIIALKSTLSLTLAAILPFWAVAKKTFGIFKLLSPVLTFVSKAFLFLGGIVGKSLLFTFNKLLVGIGYLIGYTIRSVMFVARLGQTLAGVLFKGLMIAGKGILFVGRALVTNLISFIGKTAVFAARLGQLLAGALFKGLMLAGKGILFIGRALLTTPIGLLITGIAVGAFLIYQYWEPISTWFSEKWAAVSGIFSSAWTGISNYCSEVWANITTFFGTGIGNITATILNWSPLGLFQQVFSTVLSWFGIDVPAKFTDFGKNMIDGLVNGIKNAWEGAKQIVSDLGDGIKGWFAEKLGIHSPSRVFKGYGVNVVEGLAIGMDNAQPIATEASKNLSSAVKFEPVLNSVETAFKPLLNEKKGFLGTLWDDIKFGAKFGANFVGNLLGINQPADYRTPDFNPESGQNSSIFRDYQPLNRNAVTHNETTQNSGGIVVHFSPTIQLNGNQGKDDILNDLQQGLNMTLTELKRLIIDTVNRENDQYRRRAY